MIIPQSIATLNNNTKVMFRSMSPRDVKNWLNHLQLVSQDSYHLLNYPKDYFRVVSEIEEAKTITDFEKSADKFMLSAFVEDLLVGNLTLAKKTNNLATVGISVSPTHQKKGIGTNLLLIGIKHAELLLKIEKLQLTVRVNNLPAISLYEKLDFKKKSFIPNASLIDGLFYDEYLYEKVLLDHKQS